MASSDGFAGFRDISIPTINHINTLEEHEGKELLARELGIPPYPDGKDPQKEPFISYIYNCIIFALEKGFPLEHITLIIRVSHEFLKKILVEKHQISDALTDFKEVAKPLNVLSDKHQKQFADFMYETVLCHYKLYRYVFSHLRDIVHPVVVKDVYIPEAPPELSKGKTVVIHEYEEQLNLIIERETIEKNELNAKLQKAMAEKEKHKTLADVESLPVPYSKMTLSGLLKEVIKGYTSPKEKEINGIVETMSKDLEFKIEKTALPRPVILGSPPRFKPKTLVDAKQCMNWSNNTLKPGADKKGKSAKSNSGRSSAASNISKK